MNAVDRKMISASSSLHESLSVGFDKKKGPRKKPLNNDFLGRLDLFQTVINHRVLHDVPFTEDFSVKSLDL